jgi:hypothetical protein
MPGLALLLIAALSGPAPQPPQTPEPAPPAEHPHCLFTKLGGPYEGSCGPLFEETPTLTLHAVKEITTGRWRKDLHPVSVWAVEAKGSESLSQPMEIEVYSGGSGVFRSPLGWFAVSGFVQARDTLKFDLDVTGQVPPNDLDRAVVQRAASILSSDAVWNRADDRVCKADARTWSIYCALEHATVQLTGGFHHRRPALEVVRAIIDERTAGRGYEHRLMDYNNDPTTHLQDVQSLFTEALARIERAAPPTPVKLDIKTIAPAARSAVNEFSTIVAALDYQVGNFEPERYFVTVAFATDDPDVLKVATDSSLPKQWELRKSADTVKVSQPLRTLWKDPHVTHPIKVYFELREHVDRNVSHVLLTLGPIEFQEQE